jgi:uncharacterized LabA/DUF88 family protein
MIEPAVKRVIGFVDGQNLFYAAKHAFGHVGREEGIDVRIAPGIVRLARSREYDVALVFSQDQDLSEVADEIRAIAREQGRWIKTASAYPSSPASTNRRGINETDWIRLDRATFDLALDPRGYRPKKGSGDPTP